MRSLFVASLPRSLSTEVYDACRSGLGLRSPSWTSAGEILNLDRFSLQGPHSVSFPKYILPKHGAIYASTLEFLDHAFVTEGFCYKDVTQPFVVAAWLNGRPGTPVIKIKPNIAHVAFAMLQRKWLYPSVVGRQSGSLPGMMVEGLLLAEATLDAMPGETVAFDALVDGFASLDAILARLSPGQVPAPAVLPQDFERRRDEVLSRRRLDAFKHLEDLEGETRERLSRLARPPAAT